MKILGEDPLVLQQYLARLTASLPRRDSRAVPQPRTVDRRASTATTASVASFGELQGRTRGAAHAGLPALSSLHSDSNRGTFRLAPTASDSAPINVTPSTLATAPSYPKEQSVADTAVADTVGTTVADTAVAETAVAADTAVAETTPVDTTPADTTIAESIAADDTTATDNVADKFVADTFVADTTVVDTNFGDTAAMFIIDDCDSGDCDSDECDSTTGVGRNVYKSDQIKTLLMEGRHGSIFGLMYEHLDCVAADTTVGTSVADTAVVDAASRHSPQRPKPAPSVPAAEYASMFHWSVDAPREPFVHASMQFVPTSSLLEVLRSPDLPLEDMSSALLQLASWAVHEQSSALIVQQFETPRVLVVDCGEGITVAASSRLAVVRGKRGASGAPVTSSAAAILEALATDPTIPASRQLQARNLLQALTPRVDAKSVAAALGTQEDASGGPRYRRLAAGQHVDVSLQR